MTIIRRAIDSDYDALPAIEDDADQMFRDVNLSIVADLPSSTRDYFASLPENSAVYVATDDADKIIGFAVGIVVDNQAYLKQISVKRISARKGVGTALANQIITWAKEQSFDTITLTTFRDLPFNGVFYKKLGFTEFAPDATWPELQKIRAKEKELGIELIPRVAMRLELKI